MPNLLRRYLASRDGNFAMMASVVAVPLLLGAGLALDLSNIARKRTELQAAIDSAVLAIAREGKDVPDERAREIAWQFLGSNFDRQVTKIDVVRDGTSYQIDATSTKNLAFGTLFGHETWPIQAQASADIAYATYEIGLVLDTTGSMKGGKLKAMKEAVHGLIDSMSAQVNDKDRLKFALVPFSSFVNVGPNFGPKFDVTGKQIVGTGAAWLDLYGKSPIPQAELPVGLSRFQLFSHLNQPWKGCVETRPLDAASNYGIDDTTPKASDPESLFVPAFAIDEEDTGYPNSYLTGAVKSNDKTANAKPKKMKKYGVPVKTNDDVLPYGESVLLSKNGLRKWTKVPADTGSSVYAGLNKGPGFGCVSKPIVPLSNNYAALKDDVSALEAAGNTNIMEGVAWGQRVLSPGEPFTEGQDKAKVGVEKMMIVLTDGSNTFGNTSAELGSLYSSFGYLTDGRLGITAGSTTETTAEMNKQTLAACTAAKVIGIEVYTIRLEEPNVATGTMLEECASGPDHYFDVPTRARLDEAFSSIRDRIVRIRIAS